MDFCQASANLYLYREDKFTLEGHDIKNFTTILMKTDEIKTRINTTKNLVFFKELRSKSPGRVSQNLIHISTVPERFVSFVFRHDCETFEFVGQFIAAHCWENNRQ